MIKSIVVLCALIVVGDNKLWAAEENVVYNELVTQGVKLSNGKTITLPKPVMADGLTADAQKDVLKNVLTVKARQKEFENGDPRDCYDIKQVDEKGRQLTDPIGRRVDLFFVAKGKLDTLKNGDFVQKQLKAQNPNAKSKIEFYNAKELEIRKLATKDTERVKQRYAHAFIDSSDLLGAVQVQGGGFGIETLNPESIVIAFKLDPRFDKDPEYPNQYQTAKTDQNGKLVLGPEKPYSGFAGYAKITKLQGPEDKVFVEYHLIYDEPHEWFNGTTALASKLETNYFDNIKKFRRNLIAKPAANPPANQQPDDQAKSAKK